MPAKISIDLSRLRWRPGLQMRDVDVPSSAGNTGAERMAFKKGSDNQACR
jgi:hypothetical protein